MSRIARLIVLVSLPVALALGLPRGVRGQSDQLMRLPPVDAPGSSAPLGAAQAAEELPAVDPAVELAATAEPWAEWLVPALWESNFELGLEGSEGNSQTLSFRVGGKLKFTSDVRRVKVDLTYTKATANAVETKHNALLGVNHEWLFRDTPWTVFADLGIEYDEFKAFDLRANANAGLGYQILKTDATDLVGRFGAGVSREFGGPDNSLVPEAVFGMEYERRLTKKQKLSGKFEFFPEWGDFTNYRLRTDAGWELVLDQEANLSLKVRVIDRYDSTPNGRRPNDLEYSVLLLWKP